MPSTARKATDQEILAAYAETNSVWRAAKALGMCGQSVHERLVKLNANNHTPVFTEAEKDRILLDYSRMADEGRAGELAKEMGRNRHNLARQARKMGLTIRNRKRPYISESVSIRTRKWLKHNPHPRGMLGKTHTAETRKKLSRPQTAAQRRANSERMIKRWHSMSKEQQIAMTSKAKVTWKQGWREIGGQRIYCRSSWEANYARYLEWLLKLGEIAKWEHEPETFWFLKIKRGTRSYLPDFRITENNGSVAYHEVKGWMDRPSVTKIKRMALYHPTVKLIVVNSKNYKALEKMVSRMIVGWESSK